MSLFVVGVDLAQQSDYTAISVIEATPSQRERTITERMPGLGILRNRREHYDAPPVTMALRWLERLRGVPYPSIVDHIGSVMGRLPEPGLLVLDATGVGRPVVDMVEAAGLLPFAVTIHGGSATSGDGRDWRVPKVDLVSVLMVAMQTERLKIAPSLALAPVLSQELANFKLKINPATMHESFAAWREAEHDDLVLASALAVWLAEEEIAARAAAIEQEGVIEYDDRVAISLV